MRCGACKSTAGSCAVPGRRLSIPEPMRASISRRCQFQLQVPRVPCKCTIEEHKKLLLLIDTETTVVGGLAPRHAHALVLTGHTVTARNRAWSQRSDSDTDSGAHSECDTQEDIQQFTQSKCTAVLQRAAAHKLEHCHAPCVECGATPHACAQEMVQWYRRDRDGTGCACGVALAHAPKLPLCLSAERAARVWRRWQR